MSALDPGRGLNEQRVTLADGRVLRAVLAGDGAGPLVVFEAGMSAPAASWVHTQREISQHARTMSYDRAGYGGSDVDPAPRTIERIVEDLAALLDELGETKPVVLVGHSWGGPILRLFAEQHPHRVGGLVFVDATLTVAMPERNAKIAARSFGLMKLIARLGGIRLLTKLNMPHGISAQISPEDEAIMLRDFACLQAMSAGQREAQQIIAALPTMHRLEAQGTPAVPTVCIQGGRADRGTAKLRPLMNDAAGELMAKVPDGHGRLVVVADAGHLIPQEQPAAVRDVILEVLDAVGAKR